MLDRDRVNEMIQQIESGEYVFISAEKNQEIITEALVSLRSEVVNELLKGLRNAIVSSGVEWNTDAIVMVLDMMLLDNQADPLTSEEVFAKVKEIRESGGQ